MRGVLAKVYASQVGHSAERNEEAVAMTVEHVPAGFAPSAVPLEHRLERGEIITYPICPFALPQGDDRQFLMEQQHSPWGHKNISYNPQTGRVTGFRRRARQAGDRLGALMAQFSQAATAWLSRELPRYAEGWQLDRASLQPEEEATRRLRLSARNDLLHVDAFPTRPTHGARILRLFVNFHPSDPRVWVTSDTFERLLARYGEAAGLPRSGRRSSGPGGWALVISRLLDPFSWRGPIEYDQFMLRLHHYLKTHDEFQERCAKRYWYFPPGSAWLAFTDGVAHAVLRGRYALEHSYLIPARVLSLPDESPAALLARHRSGPPQARAA